MSEGISRRGKNSWRIKFDLPRDPVTGERRTRYHTVRGTRKEAEAERIRLLHAAHKGNYVDPSKMTVAEFMEQWDRDWASASNNLSPKTLERYRQLIRLGIVPHIGSVKLQQLKPLRLVEFYAKLSREGREDGGGYAPRTVGQLHRVLYRALGHAVRWGLVQQNVAAIVDPPKVEAAEIEILTEDQIRAVLAALRATTSLYPLICLALATGMRRGELCALRWGDVDLEGGSLRVEQSLEQTAAGLRFKSPKTKHGRRSISLPAYAVAELKAHWANQNEKRLAMGLGKAPEGALVFCHGDGEPLKPDNLSKEWRRLVKVRKLPRVTFHALRHTHASQLIAAGVDVLTLSRRLGHGSPAITLGVYGHIFGDSDDKAARALEAAFQRAKTD